MALRLESIHVAEKPLFIPPIADVVEGLKIGFSSNFKHVEVSAIDCPDLTKSPFNLAAEGLNGCPTIVEVGGVPYLMPLVDRTKIYDFKDINKLTGVNCAFVIGAGAGPFSYAGVNCELVANLTAEDGKIYSLSQIAKVKDECKGNDFVAQKLPDSESTYALMGNYFVSEGKPGKVLRVKCTGRTGKLDFINAARESLVNAFPNKSIGVGGAFLVAGSKVKQHVMPDFSSTPLVNDDMVNDWLRFYNMDPPLVAVGTFVTNDPGLNLRLVHFHSMSDHGAAGHYHHDTEPENVEYLAYFNLGSRIVRVDSPSVHRTVGHN